MATTLHCTHKGCERSFSKPSETRAKQALQMHVDRVHLKTIVTPSGPRNPKSRDYQPLTKTADVKPIAKANGHSKHVHSSNGRAHKKVKLKRLAGVNITPTGSNEFKFNFCPNCGGNIHEVAQGVVIARKLKENPKLLNQVLALLD